MNSSLIKTLSLFGSGMVIYYTSKYLYQLWKKGNPKSILPKLDSEELIREELKRNYEFFEEEGMKKIRDSFVIIVGLESIGSNVALTLARSGVKKIRLIDNSYLTDLDYPDHPCAVRSDISKLNSEIIEYYAKSVNPQIEIEIINDKFNINNANEQILEGKPNYVIDCISNEKDYEIKCDLIKFVSEHNINIITAMNPGKGSFDPTKVRLCSFVFVENDETARKINKIYKKKYNEGVPNIKTVYNSEIIKDNAKNYNLTSLKAIISQVIVSKVLCELAGFDSEAEIKKIEEKQKNEALKKEKNKKGKNKAQKKQENKKEQNKDNANEQIPKNENE